MIGAVILSQASLDPIIEQMGKKYNIDPAWIKAHIKAESNWDVNASRFEAHKGDSSWGLMQLLLSTARQVLGKPNLTTTELIQPAVNIEAGTKFLSQLWKRFGNMRDAIAAYNAGSPRIDKSTGKYTNQYYVDKVSKFYSTYKQLGTTAGNIAIEATEGPTSMYILAGVGLLGLVYVSTKD